ncbi:MAG: glycosyltransferase family 1 protein [Candidatus Taylorbacteria bacterium]|nr:glycosyltransferase family 1 protein [Candidatus Taylorbacteria bacterium]
MRIYLCYRATTMPTAKKKIIYIITKGNWGGAQRYVFDLATALPQENFDVVVACSESKKTEGGLPGILVQKLLELGIKVIPIHSFTRDISILKEFSALRELYSVIKITNPDVVHLNSSKAGGIGAFAARVCRTKEIIFTVHGLPWDEDRNILSRTLIFLSSYLTFLLCHKVILISKNNFERIRRLPFCGRKAVLIHNGVAPIDFRPREEAQREIMGTPIRKTPWVGVIAEFTKNKGLLYLIESAAILKKHGVAFRMSIIGDGDMLPEVKKRAIEYGLYNSPNSPVYIDLPGFVSDVATNLKAFDMLVLPSTKEGLPYVLLEAGLASLPVIATSVGGIPDIIQNGKTGLIVPPGDSQRLAEEMQKLLGQPNMQAELGTTLRKHVEREFSFEAMLQKTFALYASARE